MTYYCWQRTVVCATCSQPWTRNGGSLKDCPACRRQKAQERATAKVAPKPRRERNDAVGAAQTAKESILRAGEEMFREGETAIVAARWEAKGGSR